MRKTFFLVCSLFLLACFSCSSRDDSTPEWIWGTDSTTTDTTDIDDSIVALGWTNVSSDYGTIPSYITVYKSPSYLEDKKAIAYIAVADMSEATFSVLGDSTGYQYLSDFYSDAKSTIVMNGGFFYNGVSLSLICRNGIVLCPNNQVDSEDWITLYYPTRGAFGKMADGTYSTTWTYTTMDGVTYSYPQPAANKYGNTPLETPSSTFPSGATLFSGNTVIGGGPVLIKDGTIENTYEAELLDINPTSNRPRSAIGITADNKIIFFVAEGDNMTPNVAGFTTGDVAAIMLSLGCTEAMNLDGGGSSRMLINGNETITPSDESDRKIVTAVSLK